MRTLRFLRAALLCTAALGVGCGSAVDPEDDTDALMLSNNTQVSRNAQGEWELGAVGVTVNVILATSETAASFERISPSAVLYQGVTSFESEQGPASITMSTSLQTATATYNAGTRRYDIGGLSGAAVYADMDVLSVTADGATVTVPAPTAVGTAADLLGEPMSFRTQVRLPDNGFDTLYVFMPLSGGGGETGIIRLVPAADMQIENGRRVAPMLDEDSIAALSERGLSASAVYVAAYRQMFDSSLFGEDIPVQAGRMFQLSPAALEAAPAPTAN